MGFFDKIASAGKEVAQSVAETTKSFAGQGKAKVGILQTQSDLRDLYREYGEFCYKAERAGSCDETEKTRFMTEMDELNGRIAQLEAEGDAARQQAEDAAAQRSAAREAQSAYKEGRVCHQCGTVSSAGAVFCGNCGTKLVP
ncbi:MAG: hypothetical protein RR998_04270 [Oscillospiraceae bacterium]